MYLGHGLAVFRLRSQQGSRLQKNDKRYILDMDWLYSGSTSRQGSRLQKNDKRYILDMDWLYSGSTSQQGSRLQKNDKRYILDMDWLYSGSTSRQGSRLHEIADGSARRHGHATRWLAGDDAPWEKTRQTKIG
jgi:hypothetical protein